MHELAIIESVIELAEREARQHDAARITKIKLRIGEFTGVVAEALEFAFEVAREGTLADAAVLEIERVPLRKRCPACGKMDDGGFAFFCADCRAPVEILSGREMQIEYVELE
jgi:hydrogenase nickel incorporation protein HypA/HybF